MNGIRAVRSLPSPFVIGVFLVVFLACYAPVLLDDYGILDDYAILAAGPQGGPIGQMTANGRPFQALVTQLFLHGTTEIEDLRYARCAGVLGIAVLAWSVFRTLAQNGWSRFHSFCIAVVMCSALPFQVYAAWATTAPFPYAALASGLAFFLGERAFATRRRAMRWLPVAGAISALLAGLAIYQPAAMFFWVFVAIVLLKPEASPREMLHRFLWLTAIGLTGMLAGFVLYELSPTLNPDFSARTGLVQDIPTKIVWFLAVSFPSALNFALPSPSWWLFQEAAADLSIRLYHTLSSVLNALDVALLPSHPDVDVKASHAWFSSAAPGTLSFFHKIMDVFIAYGFFAVVFGGLWLYFRDDGAIRPWKYVVAISLLFLSAAPILSVAENSTSYRSMPGLVSMVVLYTCFAFRGYTRRLPRLLSPARANAVVGGVAILCILSATHHVRAYFVAPQSQELALMRSQLAGGGSFPRREASA